MTLGRQHPFRGSGFPGDTYPVPVESLFDVSGRDGVENHSVVSDRKVVPTSSSASVMKLTNMIFTNTKKQKNTSSTTCVSQLKGLQYILR